MRRTLLMVTMAAMVVAAPAFSQSLALTEMVKAEQMFARARWSSAGSRRSSNISPTLPSDSTATRPRRPRAFFANSRTLRRICVFCGNLGTEILPRAVTLGI
jgi:hypothetical protein